MIKKFEEYIDEGFSIKNGLLNNPKRQSEEMKKFIEVTPDIIDKLKKVVDRPYFIDYRCYPYEEHIIGYLGVGKDGEKQELLGKIEFEELDDIDKLIDKLSKLVK